MLKDKLKKQIIFSDYDGTIYITEEDMEKNIEKIKEYRDIGGKFVIVTGRSKTSIKKVIEKYDIPYDYIISNNGAIIFDSKGNKLYEQTIKADISNKIIEYLKTKQNIEIYYYTEEDKIQYNNQELLKIRIKTTDKEITKNIESEINRLFEKDAMAHANFPSMYYDDLNYSIVDIVSRKAGKEGTIRKLLEILKIESNQAITIGDVRNDINMIKEYNGYSMETAEKEAKEVASKIFRNIADAIDDLKK